MKVAVVKVDSNRGAAVESYVLHIMAFKDEILEPGTVTAERVREGYGITADNLGVSIEALPQHVRDHLSVLLAEAAMRR